MELTANAEQFKQEFIQIYNERICRNGDVKLLKWLSEETEFFVAPASTRFHGSYIGGLCNHSINVYERLMQKCGGNIGATSTTIAVVSLLHDICKHDNYTQVKKNQKNSEGQWVTVNAFEYSKNSFPFGHGEKSVYLINKFMQLSDTEAIAIRWHMGAYDEAAKGGSATLSQALSNYPLALYLHEADNEASLYDDDMDGNDDV